MKLKDALHLPKLTDLGEFARSEFADAVTDIRSALLDEAWFDRTSSSMTRIEHPAHGWHRTDEQHAERDAEDPLRRTRNHDHPQELDFDR